MIESGGKFSRKQEVAIAVLLSSPTISDAAKAVGVTEQTLWRWLGNEEFDKAFKQAKKQALTQAINRLQQISFEAVETLRNIMKNEENAPSSRVAAAKIVLEQALKAFELEEIVVRVEKLEHQLNEKGA